MLYQVSAIEVLELALALAIRSGDDERKGCADMLEERLKWMYNYMLKTDEEYEGDESSSEGEIWIK